jgi:hypothetical protein
VLSASSSRRPALQSLRAVGFHAYARAHAHARAHAREHAIRVRGFHAYARAHAYAHAAACPRLAAAPGARPVGRRPLADALGMRVPGPCAHRDRSGPPIDACEPRPGPRPRAASPVRGGRRYGPARRARPRAGGGSRQHSAGPARASTRSAGPAPAAGARVWPHLQAAAVAGCPAGLGPICGLDPVPSRGAGARPVTRASRAQAEGGLASVAAGGRPLERRGRGHAARPVPEDHGGLRGGARLLDLRRDWDVTAAPPGALHGDPLSCLTILLPETRPRWREPGLVVERPACVAL